MDTLAAACAEAGDFPNAVRWENAALLCPDQDVAALAERRKRLTLYEAHKPYRQQNNQTSHSGFSP